MTTATASVVTNNQSTLFQETRVSYNATEPNGVKRSKQFTPAYAHPMHQPQHMELHHYQLQNQEEIRRKQQVDEKRNKQQQERFEREKRKEIDMQEKRRDEERERQQKFEMQFEQRQKQLQKGKPVQKATPAPILPVKQASTSVPVKSHVQTSATSQK